MSDTGTALFDVITEHRAQDLLAGMEKASPATRAQLTRADADHALLEALDALERDPESAHMLHVIGRARAIHLARMTVASGGAA